MIPTPRGGGVSVVICTLIVLAFLPLPHKWSLWWTSALIASVSYVDDHIGLGYKLRLACQLLLGGGYVASELSLSSCVFPWFSDSWFCFAGGFVFLGGIVWVANLYNFMDGIDGIAATETLFVTLSLAVLYTHAGAHEWAFLMLTIACSCFGFLFWNWAPAKIFMGDVGSVFLGWVLGVSMLSSAQQTNVSMWVYVILMGGFIADATFTLFSRILRGERVWLPHRTHLYQLLSIRFGDHRKVNYILMIVNVVWLLPMAIFAYLSPDYAWACTISAYIPLSLLYYTNRRQIMKSMAREG
ncbi:glycosyltransferase family 4 protein [Hahella sp. KA22]|uniref:MraY family glycosyltransferase n=1 Tax=Hahella sp. KA22 TaxID=1628392 RepID=UPI002110BAA1|nr:glycosyltransferase family 4 protein [Hahella sp. KA22]